MGDKVERQKRDPTRGAEGAKGVGCEEGECPIPRNFFLRFWGKNGVLSWTLGAKFCFFFYDQNSIEIHLEYKDCHGD